MSIKFLFKFKYNIINNLPSFKTLRKNQTIHMKTIQGKTKFNILDFIDDEAEVSDTNTKILEQVLTELMENGYEFKSLNELP